MLSHLLTKVPKAWLRLNIHTSCLAKVGVGKGVKEIPRMKDSEDGAVS